MKRARAAVAFLLITLAAAPIARAQPPSVDACAAAYEEAQRRQAKGELLRAREQATTCANPACPGEIVGFCSAMAGEIEKSIPSLVVAALDDHGKDIAGATLVIDGGLPAAPVGGRPVIVDPGEHRLSLQAEGYADIELTVSVLAGEKNRRVEARFSTHKAGPGASPKGASPLFVPAGIAFGIGGAGLLLGAIAGGLALADDSALDDSCPSPTTCPSTERERIDRMESLGVASTTGFVIGGVGVATALVLVIVAVTQGKASDVKAGSNRLVIHF